MNETQAREQRARELLAAEFGAEYADWPSMLLDRPLTVEIALRAIEKALSPTQPADLVERVARAIKDTSLSVGDGRTLGMILSRNEVQRAALAALSTMSIRTDAGEEG